MVTIRLTRGGAKKRPFYHVVVTDSRSPRDGRFIERIGYYNPIAAANESSLVVDPERLQYWLSKGAQASARVLHLVKSHAPASAA
jgi:small subunit ribosomal protein S16